MEPGETVAPPGAPTPSLNKGEHRFIYRGWDVVVQLDGITLDGCVSGHAELCAGNYHCRLVLASPHHDGASAMHTLSEKARALVDNREALAAASERRPDSTAAMDTPAPTP
jgi:hypothetical protein